MRGTSSMVGAGGTVGVVGAGRGVSAAWMVAAAVGLACGAVALAAPGAGGVTDTPASPSATAKAQAESDADRLREDMRKMIGTARDRVYPALVNIKVITMNYYGGKEHKGGGTGSGTIISPEGYVVTNQHVTANGKKFKVTMADKQEVNATLIAEDPLTDLAVIKIHTEELRDPTRPLHVAQFGDSDELQPGDYVMAMGSPFSLSRSVTLGIVSNTERVFAGGGFGDDELEDMQLEPGQRTGLFTRWVQHDALINPGNSGGPLVNLRGEIVGVNELGGTGMGFAIPGNLAKGVAKSLVDNKEVPRSFIGVSFKPIGKTGYAEGVLVNSVIETGAAYAAGLRAGDIVTKIDGKATTVRFPEEIPVLAKGIADRPIGSKVVLAYIRDGKDGTAEVTTQKLLKDRGDEGVLRSWGLSVMEITEKMARDMRLDNADGVYISGVKGGSSAATAEPAVLGGDILRSVDGKPVKTFKELVDAYEVMMKQEKLPEYVLLEFERQGKNQLTVIKPKPEKADDPPREVPKGWIGVATQPVLTKLADKMGKPEAQGFRVTRVYPGTLAAKSDLKVGDIIVGLDGDAVKPKTIADAGLFQRQVRKKGTSGDSTVSVLRGDEKVEIKVPLERTRIEAGEALKDRNTDFELTVRELTFFDRDENRWNEGVKGVLVEGAERAGWAGLGGIGTDDLIQKIAGHEVTDIKSYREAMEAVTKEQPQRVVFIVLRGVSTHFKFVEPEWKPAADADKDKPKATGGVAAADAKPDAGPRAAAKDEKKSK